MRPFGLTIALLAGCAGLGNAQVFCTTGITGSVPTLSASSTAGSVADFTLSCGTRPGQSGVISGISFSFYLSSAILNTGAWSLMQGANTYAGTLTAPNGITFTGVSYDLSQPDVTFQLQGVQVNPERIGARHSVR